MQTVERAHAEDGIAPGAVAVVFRTHFFDAEVTRRLRKLRDGIARHCAGTDIHLLVETGTQVPPEFETIATRFSYRDYAVGFPKASRHDVYPGNHHLPALYFAEIFPRYGHYWFIEYDVVYTGNWGKFLNEFRTDRSHLLAAHIREFDDLPGWYWAGSLESGEEDFAGLTPIAAFLPIYRASALALDTLRDACARGWSGHVETLMPTAIHAAGLTLSDMGGTGKWTPPDRRQRHYLAPEKVSLWETVSTLRYRPNIIRPLLPRILHHPCKTRRETGLYDNWKNYRRAYRNAPSDMSRFFLTVLSQFLPLPRR